MTYLLIYLAGVFTVFGLISVANFVFQKIAMEEVSAPAQQRHEEALEHWKRLESVWSGIADNIERIRINIDGS